MAFLLIGGAGLVTLGSYMMYHGGNEAMDSIGFRGYLNSRYASIEAQIVTADVKSETIQTSTVQPGMHIGLGNLHWKEQDTIIHHQRVYFRPSIAVSFVVDGVKYTCVEYIDARSFNSNEEAKAYLEKYITENRTCHVRYRLSDPSRCLIVRVL